MRGISLRDGAIRAIVMAKATEKPKKAIDGDPAKGMAKENTEVIVNPRNRARQEDVAREDNIPVQMRWL